MTKKIIILTTLGLVSTTMATSAFSADSALDPRDKLDVFVESSSSRGKITELITEHSMILGGSDRSGTLAIISRDDGNDSTDNIMETVVGVSTTLDNTSLDAVYTQRHNPNQDVTMYNLYANGAYLGLDMFDIGSELLYTSSDLDDETVSVLGLELGGDIDAFSVDGTYLYTIVTDENGDDEDEGQSFDLLVRYDITDNITLRGNINHTPTEDLKQDTQEEVTYMLAGAETNIPIADNVILHVMGNIGTSNITEDSSEDIEEDLMQMAAGITYLDKKNGRMLTAELGRAISDDDTNEVVHQKLDIDASVAISKNIIAAAYLGTYEEQQDDTEILASTIYGVGLSVNFDDITLLGSIRVEESEVLGNVVTDSTDMSATINYAF